MRVLATKPIPQGAFHDVETSPPHTATLVCVTFAPDQEFAFKPRRKGTREEDGNVVWDVFANLNQGMTRRRPVSNNQPTKRGRTA